MRVEHVSKQVCRLVLDRAAERNRLDHGTVRELLGGLDDAERDPLVSVLVIAAQGADFCSGLHLADPSGDAWRPHLTDLELLLRRLRESPLVTVAVVQGAATGGGVGLAAACDLVLAGPDSVFQMPEVLLGLVPALILPLVAARVGPRRAFSLALLAAPVPSAEARAIGLADACGDVDHELTAVLRRLRATEPGAVRALKRYAAGIAPDTTSSPKPPLDVIAERLTRPEVHDRLDRLSLLGPRGR